MKLKEKIFILLFIIIDAILVAKILIGNSTIAVLEPKGLIALEERDLILTILLLLLCIVIPALFLTYFFAWKYRENNKAHYTPDWDHDHKLQFFWWAFPCAIVIIMSVVNWNAAHKLDPHKPLVSETKPLTIQVVALQWKWLFIYPEQNIATVNTLTFPEKTPLNFVLTGDDTPMNSFWIPQLGGQIYAMAGMQTKLHLIANTTGEFSGSTAEISGKGFSGMRFQAHAVTQQEFDQWVTTVKQSPQTLNKTTYTKLLTPSENNPVMLYSSTEHDLFNTIVMKYMAH